MSENLSKEQIDRHISDQLSKVPGQKSRTEKVFDDTDFAEGTDPSIAVIDDVPMSNEDSKHFAKLYDDKKRDFELKSVLSGLDKAAVMATSEKDEWDKAIDAARKQVARNGETPIKIRAELQVEKKAADHAVEVAGIKKAWREEDQADEAKVRRVKADWESSHKQGQQEALKATEAKIEAINQNKETLRKKIARAISRKKELKKTLSRVFLSTLI